MQKYLDDKSLKIILPIARKKIEYCVPEVAAAISIWIYLHSYRLPACNKVNIIRYYTVWHFDSLQLGFCQLKMWC